MSYVPPHLRAAAASPNHRNATAKPQAQTLEPDRKAPVTPRNGTTPAFVPPGRRPNAAGQQPKSAVALEPVFEPWRPSDRVLSLTSEQIEEVQMRLNVDVTVASDSPPAPAPVESFTDMCLHSSIMKDITLHEYTRPTPIQAQAMPVALSGRDLLGCAETGSGKTAAFSIPMIQHCLAQPPICRGNGPLALVLAPTRELAQQIEKEKYELRAGVHIVVATPGRFIDHLQQGNTSLSRISFVVLDEADRMLDMGFEPQIREVMQSLPKKHQTLLFSATMPVEIETLAQEYLCTPVQIKVGKVSSPTANVSQILEKVTDSDKIDRLLSLLVEEASHTENSSHCHPLTVVFVERKARCDEVAEALVAQGLHAVALHGGRNQSEREAALNNFRKGTTNILVATDVASRGLDVTGVAHVINLDLPKTMEDYVHRIGRTGRAGSFLVAQIRKSISDVESGNTIAFASGKTARKKEREAAAAQREARVTLSKISLNDSTINVDEKYRYMLTPTTPKQVGVADDAWDD
ncbi:hypothetical protein J5N97_025806 [Dioscorea zingiberensis]|uniref:RNA helicase n=1 Tax=Dioscorea zingiberensis TaxID=325984 RepID=A0A9D5H631_9LILI|nr:hypothetical protein J5N97_025806 [Dioscorea zingiberensis]